MWQKLITCRLWVSRCAIATLRHVLITTLLVFNGQRCSEVFVYALCERADVVGCADPVEDVANILLISRASLVFGTAFRAVMLLTQRAREPSSFLARAAVGVEAIVAVKLMLAILKLLRCAIRCQVAQ